MPLRTDFLDNEPGHTARTNETNAEVNRVAALADKVHTTSIYITDLNAAPIGMSFAFGDAANRPPAYFHCVVETYQLPAPFRYQQAFEFGSTRIAQRYSDDNGATWKPWAINS